MDSRKGNASSTTQLVKERNQSSNKVKLCGYLKKKRNKVGGWRKMWFVLQDKLLLSYASKEEYDNKLVSFKDVLNLVPGTLVRPLGGFRFTIETTSHAMYTFHCDDRNAYREWIAVLLDSLAGGHSHKAANSFVQRFHNLSADNIPQALCFNAALQRRPTRDISNSCDSIRQRVADSADYECCHYERQCERFGEHMERAALPPTSLSPSPPFPLGCVRLPIARSTAKILERNGVNSSGHPQPQPLMAAAATAQQQQQQQRPLTGGCNRSNYPPIVGSYVGGKHHFRLHRSCSSDSNDGATELHSSRTLGHPVATINRMFQQATATDDSRVQSSDTKRRQDEAMRSNCDQNECQRYSNGRGRSVEKWNLDCMNASHPETCSCSSDDGKALDMVRDRIERMSIKGFKESATDATADAVERREARSKVITTRGVEEVVMACASRSPLGGAAQSDCVDTAQQPEPIYAVVDLQHKYAQRKLRNNCAQLKRCNSYDSIMQSPVMANGRMQRHEQKYASSAIGDDIDGIYEDGDTFFANTANNLNGSSAANAKEENIYEPINVPTTTAQPNAFWKYFTRLKVNSLLHLTSRMRKRESATYETVKLPSSSLAATRAAATDTAAPQSAAALQFSTIKHKFGTHRKSMQVRVRRLCARAYEPKPFFRHHKPHHLQPAQQQPQSTQSNGNLCGAAGNSHCNNNNNNNSNSKKSKYRWKSVKIRPKYLCAHNGVDDSARGEKQRFFGSLPHLRKARTSIFTSSHLQLTNDGRAPAANKSNLSTNST